MFNKSFVSILIVTSSFILSLGQTPEANKEKGEKIVKTFSMSFDGDGGYLGVSTQEITKDNFAKYGLREVRGVAVEKVLENSPAAAAGLQNGDVIVRFNGEEVTGTRKLTRLISEVAPDHQVKLTVIRGGSEQEIAVTLGKRPVPKFENGTFNMSIPDFKGKIDMPELDKLKDLSRGTTPHVFTIPDGVGKNFVWRSGEGRQIGVGVTPLTKQLASYFGVESGVMINEVRENSPASKAGLKAGDIIVEADGKAIKGDFDLVRAINAKKEGDISLTIVRDGRRQTISVTPEKSKDSGFVFETDDEDDLPGAAGQVILARPVTPATPMTAPAAVTFARPGRIL